MQFSRVHALSLLTPHTSSPLSQARCSIPGYHLLLGKDEHPWMSPADGRCPGLMPLKHHGYGLSSAGWEEDQMPISSQKRMASEFFSAAFRNKLFPDPISYTFHEGNTIRLLSPELGKLWGFLLIGSHALCLPSGCMWLWQRPCAYVYTQISSLGVTVHVGRTKGYRKWVS